MKRKTLMVIVALMATMITSLLFASCISIEVVDAFKVEITNKEALTQEWVEGSETRELQVKFYLDGDDYTTGRAYTLETSNGKVVSIGDDNKTLTAEGEGSAIITVTAVSDRGNIFTDSVEIAVIPYIRAVEIANDDNLSEVWVIGEADRTLELKFKPEYYQTNTPDFTTVSSDNTVISVGEDNLTLTAEGIGTATITVTAVDHAGNERTDEITLTVRPELESITIVNEEALAAEWSDWTVSRTLEIALQSDEYWTLDNTPYTVTATEGLIEVDGLTLTAKGEGTATVTVSARGETASYQVEIVRSAPVITFEEAENFVTVDGVNKLGAYEGEEAVLPVVKARTCYGEAVEVKVTLVQEGNAATIENGVVKGAKGTYTVEFTAVDNIDENLVTTETIEVTFARDLIAYSDGSWSYQENAQYVADEDQVLINKQSSSAKQQMMVFNNDIASKYYYIEVEYVTEGSYYGGIANYTYTVGEDGKVSYNMTKMLVSAVFDRSDNFTSKGDRYMHYLADYYTTKPTSGSSQSFIGSRNEDPYNTIFQRGLKVYRDLKENEQCTSITKVSKMAVARVGDYYVCFWNDQYITMLASDTYGGDVNTVPGLFLLNYNRKNNGGDSDRTGDTSVKAIDYFNGEEKVMAKLAELTDGGKDVTTSYVPADWAQNSMNTNNRYFTTTSDEDGLGYTFTDRQKGFNNGMVSNYVWFEGDFTYSWDYVSIGGDKNSDYRNGATMEIRTANGLAAVPGDNQLYGWVGSQGKFTNFGTNTLAFGDAELKGIDASEGFRFIVTRKSNGSNWEYTYTAVSLADGTVYTQTKSYAKTVKNDIVTIQWHNFYAAGTYDNITWTNEAKIAHEDHAYDANSKVSYEWSEDGLTCTAKAACRYPYCNETLAETVTSTVEKVVSATCTTPEYTTYSVTFENSLFTAQEKTVATKEALGHDMQKVDAKPATTEAAGWNEHFACTRCDYKEGYKEDPQLESAPKITFAETANFTENENGGVLVALEGEEIILPVATANTWKKVDITDKMTITPYGGASIKDNVVTASKGSYEIVYYAKDLDNETLETTKVITVNVYRNMIAYNDGSWTYVEGAKYVEDDKQVLYNAVPTGVNADASKQTNTEQTLVFANTLGSKYYYVEVEYVTTGSYFGGLANYKYTVAENGEVTYNFDRVLASAIYDRQGTIQHSFSDYYKTKPANNSSWNNFIGSRNESPYNTMNISNVVDWRCISENAKNSGDTKVSKMAIARMGDYFICFWNDEYLCMLASDTYGGENNTVPGLYLLNFNRRGGNSNKVRDCETTVQNIVYFDGQEDVATKLAALTDNGKDINTSYVTFDDAKASINTNNKLFDSYGVTEENGLSYTFKDKQKNFSNGMVSNYVWFEGDFTYSWEYVNEGGDALGTTESSKSRYGALMEIRTRNSYAAYGDDNQMFGWFGKEGTFENLGTNNIKFSDDELAGIDSSKGFKYTVSRKMHETYAEWTYTAKSLADGKEYTKTLKYAASADSENGIKAYSQWNYIVTLQWHNTYAAGTYSNITWSNTAA